MDINNFNGRLERLNLIIDEMIRIMGENHDFFDGHNLRDKLDLIFNGRIGDCFQEDKLKEIYKEGNERYSNKIPPGFKDEKYGDLIIWHQIMDFAKDNNKSIIFVTQDSKIDWWFKSKSGDALMPHPHLIREFSFITNQKIYLYNFSEFLNNANSYLNANVNSDTIESVKGIEKYDKFIHFKDISPNFSFINKYGKLTHDPDIIEFRNIEVLSRIGPDVTVVIKFYIKGMFDEIYKDYVNMKLSKYRWFMDGNDYEFDVDYLSNNLGIIGIIIHYPMSKWEEIDDVVELLRNRFVEHFINYYKSDSNIKPKF